MKVNKILNNYIRNSYKIKPQNFLFKRGIDYIYYNARCILSMENNNIIKKDSIFSDITANFKHTKTSSISDIQEFRKNLKIQCKNNKILEKYIRYLSDSANKSVFSINRMGFEIYKLTELYLKRKGPFIDKVAQNTMKTAKDLLAHIGKKPASKYIEDFFVYVLPKTKV